MARTIAPANPPVPQANNITPMKADFSLFKDVADNSTKIARQNFELSTTLAWKQQSLEAYNSFKNDPIKLSKALEAIQSNIVPSDMPTDLQDQLRGKMMLDGISMVTKANDNYERVLDKQNKILATANYEFDTANAQKAYFDYLIYQNSPKEEQDIEIPTLAYNALGTLAQNALITDRDGDFIFPESTRKEMMHATNVKTNAFKEYINSLTPDALQKFDKEVFQNAEKFQKDNGLELSTYESWSNAIKNRWNALDISNKRVIQSQATYNAAHLISEPTEELVKQIKDSNVFKEDVVKSVLKESKKSVEEYSYNPNKPTDPTSYIQAMSVLSDLLKNQDFSAEGREEALKAGAKAMIELRQLQKDNNIDPDTYNKIKGTIQQAITNKTFIDGIQEIQPATFFQKLSNIGRNDNTRLSNVLINKRIYRQAENEINNYVLSAMEDYANGMPESARKTINTIKQKTAELRAEIDLGISPEEFRRLQNKLANKESAIYNYKGSNYKFLGIQDGKPMFELSI